MNNLRYLRELDEDSGFMGRGGKKFLERAFGFLFIVVLVGLPAGCLVGGEEYDQASRERDEYRSQLQNMRLSNDQLNKDIANVYAECDALNSQLSILAALSIHDKYTEGLRRSEPVVAATPPAAGTRRGDRQPPATVRVAPGSSSTTRNTGGGQRNTGNSRSGGQQAQTGGGTQRGGGGTAATAPPPPPPSSSGGGGGAIDWGF